MGAYTSGDPRLQSIVHILVLTGPNSELRTYLSIGIEGAGYRVREPIQAD